MQAVLPTVRRDYAVNPHVGSDFEIHAGTGSKMLMSRMYVLPTAQIAAWTRHKKRCFTKTGAFPLFLSKFKSGADTP